MDNKMIQKLAAKEKVVVGIIKKDMRLQVFFL